MRALRCACLDTLGWPTHPPLFPACPPATGAGALGGRERWGDALCALCVLLISGKWKRDWRGSCACIVRVACLSAVRGRKLGKGGGGGGLRCLVCFRVESKKVDVLRRLLCCGWVHLSSFCVRSLKPRFHFISSAFSPHLSRMYMAASQTTDPTECRAPRERANCSPTATTRPCAWPRERRSKTAAFRPRPP